MTPVDLAILFIYLGLVLFLGTYFAGTRQSLRTYFLTGNNIPWWAVLISLVATETSTVTLISVPGYAFGGDLTFLQLALGYVLGRLIISTFLLPRLFTGELLTAYQPIAKRFGVRVGRLTSSLFLLTRSLSDGFRLFATGLVLATALTTVPATMVLTQTFFPSAQPSHALLVLTVGLVSVTTLTYTLLGGMKAVIWSDVIQFVIYMAGTLVAGIILLSKIPGGLSEAATLIESSEKLRVFDFNIDITRSYTFWSGLIGGIFLTAGTHGTDQMFVQRYLAARSARDASRALVWSGIVVFVQFTIFLSLGLLLWVYYTTYAPTELEPITAGGAIQTDQVFPMFIVTHLPSGLRGLVIAAVVAAAMSTLSSSLNSSAASTIGDFYLPATHERHTESHYFQASRVSTVVWAVVQLCVAISAIGLSGRIIDEVLGIQSLTSGLLLGLFALAVLPRKQELSPISGIVIGATVLIALRLYTSVSWQWYVLAGSTTTFISAWTVGWILSKKNLIDRKS